MRWPSVRDPVANDLELRGRTPEEATIVDHPESPLDPVIEVYKRDIDRASIRENLRRSPEERIRNLQALHRFAEELGRAGRRVREDR